jgi:uncharacterized protein YjeT (DUF2065 family)
MTELAKISMGLGALIVVLRLPLVLAPALARRVLYGFPRNRWAAGLLAAIDLVWVTWLLMGLSLGWFESYKMALYLMAPMAWGLLMVFVDELLAVRALGGLLILMPAPILDAARWHPSPGRYVLILMAYVMVIGGVVFVAQPHRFKRAVRFFLQDRDDLTRWVGLAGVLVGVLLVVLGIGVFK